MSEAHIDKAFIDIISHQDMPEAEGLPKTDARVAEAALDVELYGVLVDRMSVELSHVVVDVPSVELTNDEERTDRLLDDMIFKLQERYGISEQQAFQAIQAADDELHRVHSR